MPKVKSLVVVKRSASSEADPQSATETDSEDSKPRQRINLACLRCRTRKIRCDGAQPCSKCIVSGTFCDYVPVSKEENELVRQRKATAKLERLKRLKDGKLPSLLPKLPRKRISRKQREAQEKAEEAPQLKAEPQNDNIEVTSAPMPRRESTYRPPSPSEYEPYSIHPDFEGYGYHDNESTPGELEVSPLEGYFGFRHGSHYSSTSSLNNTMEQHSIYYEYPSYDSSSYPVTPESASMPSSPTYASPSMPGFMGRPELVDHVYSTKEHFAHRPSISRTYSTPQMSHGQTFPFPASPSAAGSHPSGLCMYITDHEHSRGPSAFAQREAMQRQQREELQRQQRDEMHRQQSMQAWTFPSTKPPTEAQRVNQLPPLQLPFHGTPRPSFARPGHSRNLSSPLAHEFKPIYNGPIDWTSRPLMPFPAQKVTLPPVRPTHERTYSEYGTSSSTTTTTVQTVRLAEVCQTQH